MAQATAPQKKKSKKFPMGIVVIVVAFIVSELIFHLVFGDVKHFIDETKKEPKPGDYFGIIYKGGFIVPFLMTMAITVLAFGVERFITIRKARGKGSLEEFLQKIKHYLATGNIKAAKEECNKQQGSVANVVLAGLNKYEEMQQNTELEEEKKILAISKEIEEATALELPSLEENLPILATIASVATLVALLGTVLGMIRAFAALATSGTPDPTALASGISEALINTAIGIATSAFAIIFYNIFTSMIDKLTYGIDEIGFSIAQSFATSSKLVKQ
ncbi:MAG: MotA/TolQ/ExbB proton channel family protein [Chitinophagales bacterium]|nr:MotA/TolQ/ExbB proton channel family protein [Chitinophagales bacterium]